ncbi:hypothetical protein Agau_P200314 (plasmid) [Agrobacterium tumefaciens F2]|nr:hypothetical protein Agau_P200314 [Agrobacterium tumefaciens F2]
MTTGVLGVVPLRRRTRKRRDERFDIISMTAHCLQRLLIKER